MHVGKVRLLLADDHAILREGLRELLSGELLSGESEIEVVGEAQDGHETIRRAKELQPDLVLMDISMPHTNGPEAIRAIKRRQQDIKVVVLTVHKSEEHVHESLKAGADGYVLKDDTRQELLAAIRCVHRGKTYLSPSICAKIVQGYVSGSHCDALCAGDTLTMRERGIVKLIAEGYKNKEIAQSLCISVKTVEKHRANLMKKLNMHSVSALTAYAIENGLTGEYAAV